MPDTRNKRNRDAPENRNETIKDVKRRGRPRVEKHDESAVDRRRTQIRMAQRAYRERKESTLDDLRKRVTDLNNTLELVNKAFIECRDDVLASGASSMQADQMSRTAERIQSLMKAMRNPEEQDENSSDESVTSQAKTFPPAHTTLTLSAKNVPAWMDASVLQNDPSLVMPKQGGLGYTIFDFGESSASSSHRFEPTAGAGAQPSIGISPNNMQGFRVRDIPGITPVMAGGPLEQLELPRTYSFQETTFGRRLHRAGLEAAYHLILNKGGRQKEFDRVFRLSLLDRNEKELAAAIKSILTRGPNEMLTFGPTLIHVGGAGTHYRRRDGHGSWLPKKETFNIGTVGLQTLAFLENASRANPGTAVTVEVAGYEGVWFDPYDVEGYLRERGIQIDPLSSFADIPLSHRSNTPSDTLQSGSGVAPASPYTRQNHTMGHNESYLESVPGYTAGMQSFDVTAGKLPFPGVGYSDAATGSWLNFPGQAGNSSRLPNDWPRSGSNTQVSEGLADITSENFGSGTVDTTPSDIHTWPGISPSPIVERQHGIIDVNRFVKALIGMGVCLGRTPGFRRQDVDRALVHSIFEI